MISITYQLLTHYTSLTYVWFVNFLKNETFFLIEEKIHSDYEIKINEFKSTIKQMETELDSQKSLWRNKIENLETEWTTKFKKLKEEKNEEITRHLKKSIDLIDENELLENQLEKLYLVIEQKSEQINAFEEQIYSYQTEIKKLQIQQFDGKDFLEYQLRFKAYNTQEKAVECLILCKYFKIFKQEIELAKISKSFTIF